LLAGCASSAKTAQDREFNESLVELMEEMSTRMAEKQQPREERLVLTYTNESSKIQLELDPNEDDSYLDLSGIRPAAKDTVYIREPQSAQPRNKTKPGEAPQSTGSTPEDRESEDKVRQVLSRYRRAQDLFYLEEY